MLLAADANGIRLPSGFIWLSCEEVSLGRVWETYRS